MTSLVSSVIVPTLGLIGANMLYASPIKTVRKVARTRCIGNANPWPWAMATTLTYIWMIYAIALEDYFLFFSNFPGFLLSLYFTSTALASDVSDRQLRLLKVTLVVSLGVDQLTLMLSVMAFSGDAAVQQTLVGLVSVAQLLVFYMSPMATLWNVVRNRDSSSLDPRLAAVTFLNGITWVAYGIYGRDPFLIYPNALGVFNATVQIACCCAFPRLGDDGADGSFDGDSDGLSED
ncbi:unnamed protein product, partial [Phaeothamnion confervicola]